MFECIRYTPINRSTCLGLVTVFIPKWNVELSGISLHQKDGKRWVNLPKREYFEGEVKKYYPYLRFRDKEQEEKFCIMVKDAVDKHAESQSQEIKVNENFLEEEIPF